MEGGWIMDGGRIEGNRFAQQLKKC